MNIFALKTRTLIKKKHNEKNNNYYFISCYNERSNNGSGSKKGKAFTGTIEYELKYEGMDPAQEAQMPKTISTIISGNKSKTVLDAGMYAMNTITDGDNETVLIYLDIMGQKMAYKQTKEDIDKAQADAVKPTVKLIDETKQIAGYTAKKAEITVIDEETLEENVTVIWYTDELGISSKANFANQHDGIDGYPLETISKGNEVTQIMTATSVKKGKVKDTEFLLPSDAKEMTLDEFKEMFGGGE